MNELNMSNCDFSTADLDRELIARGAETPFDKLFSFSDPAGTHQREKIFQKIKALYRSAPPRNPALRHFSTRELLQKLRQLIEENRIEGKRGVWGTDQRLDIFDTPDDRVRNNVLSTALVCLKRDLTVTKAGDWKLNVKGYRETYDLCLCEPFYNQPIAAGSICSGVLAAPGIVATAAHFADKKKLKQLRFVFGFEMADPLSSVTVFPDEQIYRGVEILQRKYDFRGATATGSDWVLIKLDREVKDRPIAVLSRRHLFFEQPVYVIGHPCGLPAKYAPGAAVLDIEKAYFMSDMDVFSGNSGAPVFCAETHEMVGIVTQGDSQDFRFVEGCWVSMVYPNSEVNSLGSRCTKVSEFGDQLRKV
jgi:hypothetical protein